MLRGGCNFGSVFVTHLLQVKAKINDKCMQLFTECFRFLPLAAVVDNRVFVTHGGLLSQDGVKLEEIEKVNRNREPPEAGIMCDLLWSDPAPFNGYVCSLSLISHPHFPPPLQCSS